ncbi:MAG TPA: DUF222 domain-containing protein [Plantibacter sp.]|uniref:HNH endonuclease signature motif containing protein n=1 Tax=unclassified Plantibacter TaxID=2624265 RepID=UPI002D06B26F|nr:DUF222 domain-containing protein [Plantibacter sp.]
MSNTSHAAGPVASDPAGTLGAVLAELMETWSGALDPIRPGADAFEQIEGMNDSGLVRVLDQIGTARQVLDVLAAHVMGGVAERSRPLVDRDPLTRRYGCANPTVFLAERWRIHRGQASSIVAVGSAITPTRFIDGELSESDYPEIASAIEHRMDDAREHSRAPLSIDAAATFIRELRTVPSHVDTERLHATLRLGIEHSTGAPLQEVIGIAKLIRTSLDQDGRMPREQRLREQQRCTLRERHDGMTELHALLAPEAAAWVRAGIDALVGKQLRQKVRFIDASRDHRSAPGEPQADSALDDTSMETLAAVTTSPSPFDDDFVPPTDIPDHRTLEQHRADALTDIFRHAGSCSTAVTELAPVSLVVRIDLHDLRTEDTFTHTGTATIDGISEPVTAATARRLAADARIIPIVLGGRSEVLDLGVGTRLFTRAQKIALAERDGGCAWTGCTHPPTYTEAHHLRWWSNGGATDLDNGILLCSFHHHRIHNDGWQITVHDNVPWFIPPPSVDLRQTPRRGGRARIAA